MQATEARADQAQGQLTAATSDATALLTLCTPPVIEKIAPGGVSSFQEASMTRRIVFTCVVRRLTWKGVGAHISFEHVAQKHSSKVYSPPQKGNG